MKVKDIIFVGIQFILIGAFFLPIELFSFELPLFIRVLFLIDAAGGLFLIITAALQLRQSLSALPSPVDHGQLVESGLFKMVRHPIYVGLLIGFFGLAFYLGSVLKIGIVLLLFILLHFKSSYEEKELEKKYPDYKAYKKRTGKFIPKQDPTAN